MRVRIAIGRFTSRCRPFAKAAARLVVAAAWFCLPSARAHDAAESQATAASAPEAVLSEPEGGELALGEMLVVPPVGAYGRAPLHVDPIHAALTEGRWRAPVAGEGVRTAAGQRVVWESLPAAAPHVWQASALTGGYAAATVASDRDRIMLLEAAGHVMAYVNGEPRAGDPYAAERTVCPVALREGENSLLFHVAAGEFKARLIESPQTVFFDLRDAAFPDLLPDESGPVFAAVLLVNASAAALTDAQLTSYRAGAQSITAAVPDVPPLGVTRLVVPIDGNLSAEEAQAGSVRVQIDLTLPSADDGPRRLADSKAFDLVVADPGVAHTRTFLSRIDGSAQPYGVLSAARATRRADPSSPAPAPGVLLALHAAGTTPRQLLDRATPLPNTHLVAPLGRREFGFDWEDWSRADAFEALADFRQREAADPHRTSVAGEADGGHGALRLAALHPDEFAAAACVDGWLDYYSYGSSMPTWRGDDRVTRLLLSCGNDQRLAPLVGNLAPVGVMVQCDAAAPEALLDQSRQLRAALSQFHGDFAYRETFRSDLPGVAPALAGDVTRFLANRSIPEPASVGRVDFVTPDVGAAAACHWVSVLAARDPGEFSRVSAACDDASRTIHAMTDNVAALRFDLSRLSPGAPVAVSIDQQPVIEAPWPEGPAKRLQFLRRGDQWLLVPSIPRSWKNPRRPGGIRTVWDRRVALVYGTQGSDDQNAWALAKARFDAEQFLVRAGGSAVVAADVDFNADADPHRNIVLYGNADTNSLWSRLLSTSPVQVRNGQASVGGRPETGDDLACLFVRPRDESPTALVAAIGGTGVTGMRATDRLPMFVSGVRLPDLLLFGAAAIERGVGEVRAAGWFGIDWNVDGGEFAWRETAL